MIDLLKQYIYIYISIFEECGIDSKIETVKEYLTLKKLYLKQNNNLTIKTILCYSQKIII